MMYSKKCFVGIDGCKNGWISIGNSNCNFKKSIIIFKEKFSDLINEYPSNSIFLVDMPLILTKSKKIRACDIEAKLFLKKRQSSIFLAPCFQALKAESYEKANRINRKITSLGLSKQSWNLFKKIIEMQPYAFDKKVFEGHPECSFAFYNKKPMDYNKTSLKGLFLRLEIINQIGFNLIDLSKKLSNEIQAKPDDLIDAAILCWSASRIVNGQANHLPKKINPSEKQKKMAIYF